jgi:predicted amidohydrolase
MRVAVVQVAYGDEEPMQDRVERVAQMVRDQRGHDLVVLPELWAPGGFAYRQWAERAQPVDGPIGKAMSAAARDAGVMLHAGSIVERPADGETGPEGRGLWNTSLVYAADGSLAAAYRKIHRFGFGAGEPKLLDAGEDVALVDLPGGARAGLSTCYDLRFPELYRRQLAAGATVFVVTWPMSGAAPAVLGLATCYDLRFPELFRSLVDLGASAYLVPSGWPAQRVAHWSALLRARAIENQAWVLGCNTAGTHNGVTMAGRSAIVDPLGEVVAEAGEGEQVLTATIDPAAAQRWRAKFPALGDRRNPDPRTS